MQKHKNTFLNLIYTTTKSNQKKLQKINSVFIALIELLQNKLPINSKLVDFCYDRYTKLLSEIKNLFDE